MPRRRLFGQSNPIVKQVAVVLGWLSLLLVMSDAGATLVGGPRVPVETSAGTPRCVTVTVMPASLTFTMCAFQQMPPSGSSQKREAGRRDK